MQVHAKISKEWRRRMTFMFIMLFGSGVWFLSDGYLMWPAEEKRFVVFKALAEQKIAAGQATTEKDPAVIIAWEAKANAEGWKVKVPKHRSDGDLLGQRIPGYVFIIAAFTFALWVVWNHRRSVRAEGEWITGASGERVNFEWIVEMDRRKWENKGIAYAIYEQDGNRRRLTLDDHKFLGCEAIILEAEKRIKARKEAGTAA
ncbi:MAG: hypothetical protein RIQ79_361 [Verrucomicrobiota bacterium]